jgi:hypothetical protein
MTPYSESTDDKKERHYNHIHSKTGMTVERALCQLKGRCRILQTKLGFQGNVNNGLRDDQVVRTGAENGAFAIKACFVVHNIFVECDDLLPDAELFM